MPWLRNARISGLFRRFGIMPTIAVLSFGITLLEVAASEEAAPTKPYIGAKVSSAGTKASVAAGVESPTGAVVINVTPDAPAATAGLLRGDLILRFGETDIQCSEDMESALRRLRPGSRPTVTFVRGNQRFETTLAVGALPVNYSLPWFDHAGGGYRIRMLDNWTMQRPEQFDRAADVRHDLLQSCEENYQLLCFRSSWPADDASAALTDFTAKRRAEHPEAATGEFQLGGARAVWIGYHMLEKRRTLWRVSWVVAGRRYVINVLGPTFCDPKQLPAAAVDLLAMLENRSPGAPTQAGEQKTPPTAPPADWNKHRAGSACVFLPKEWKPSSLAMADEGRWFVGEQFAQEATFSIVRDAPLDTLLRGMTVVDRRAASVAGAAAELVSVEVEETHRKTRGIAAALKKPDANGSMIVVTAFCDARKWREYEPVFRKAIDSLQVVDDDK